MLIRVWSWENGRAHVESGVSHPQAPVRRRRAWFEQTLDDGQGPRAKSCQERRACRWRAETICQRACPVPLVCIMASPWLSGGFASREPGSRTVRRKSKVIGMERADTRHKAAAKKTER